MVSTLDSSNSPPWGLFEDSTSSWVLYNTVSKIHQANQPYSPTARPAPPPPPTTGYSPTGRSAAAVLPICRSANQPSSNQPASWAHQLARQQTNNRATASYSTANQASGVFYARKSNFFTCTRNVSEGGAIAANGSNSHTWRCYSLVCLFVLIKGLLLSKSPY